MKRSSVIVVIFCALGLGIFCVWKANDHPNNDEQRGPTNKHEQSGLIVFAIRDIKAGSLVTSDCVEVRILRVSKVPDHTFRWVSDVVGSRPIYGIEKGQILSLYDFLPPERVLSGSRPARFIVP